MKKVITSLVILLAAAAQAEYMMWSVSDSQFSEAGLTDVAYMRVGYVTANGQQPAWAGTALTAYDLGGDTMGSTDVAYGSGNEYIVKLDAGMAAGDYSFYIELLNSSGQVIGRTGNETTHTYTTYSELSSGNYVVTGDIGAVPSVNVWHGGAITACPEPSSLALLALGAGLVGLRRKLKKGKKEIRA